MTTKLPNEQRILDLERRLSRAEAELAAMKLQNVPSSPDQIIRPVRTVDPTEGDYPEIGDTVPIVFLDAVHEGLETTVTLTERSTSQQNVAATIDGTLPEVDTDHIAFRLHRQWFLVGGGSTSTRVVIFQAPEGGIPARSGAIPGSSDICSQMVYSTDFDEIQLQALSTLTVKNFATTDICASGDRLGLAVNINGVYWAVAEDCNDESDTDFPLAG